MSSNFEKAFTAVLGIEGGLVDDPNDRGGLTKYGISKTAYPQVDIASLTIDQAKAIYRRDFWAPIRGDELQYPVAVFLFGFAVNSCAPGHPDEAVKILQRSCGAVVDGVLGSQSLAAANGLRRDGIALFCADVAMRYSLMKQFPRYGRGWLKRCFLLAMEGV